MSSKTQELLHTLFLKQLPARRDALAVISSGRRLTYGELHRRALRVAERLRAAGVEPNTLVGIVMEKGWEQPVAVLGTLYAGAAYLPIEAGLPAERYRYLLQHGEVNVVLTQSALARQLDWPANVEPVSVDELGAASDAAGFELPLQRPDDLAYVIYTSGSTGLPKGVMIEHRAAVNTVLDMNRRFAVTSADRVLALSSLSFDLSVYDIFGTLAAGGAIVLPGAADVRDPAQWADLLRRENVTIWNSVPALMRLFCETILPRPEPAETKLRLVWLSGDWIPVTLPEQIRALAPRAEIVSLGGATEAAIWSILFPIQAVDPAWRSIPYGRPMANQTIAVLDATLQPCPLGATGHLYIGGAGLARGYWRDPVKTAEAFVVHPQTGARLYRTGDLGRWLPNGNIEFLGREDLQVKIQGFRVELEEIEAVLLRYPGLQTAAVSAVGERDGDKQLVAYIVSRNGPLDAEAVREFLRRRLPEYMVPSRFFALDWLPLTANGKIDRRILPALDVGPHRPARSFVAPRSALEQTVAQIWAEALRLPRVGIHDNFFELGGHSLLAVRITLRLRLATGLNVPVRGIFDHPTVMQLAGSLANLQRSVAHLPAREAYLRPAVAGARPAVPSRALILTGMLGIPL